MAPAQAPFAQPITRAPIATRVVAPLAMPSAQRKPKLTGVARVGRTLRVRRGTWLAAPTFRYRWLRNGAPIKGATRTTYRLRRADRGRRIAARVTASNATGRAAVRTASVLVR